MSYANGPSFMIIATLHAFGGDRPGQTRSQNGPTACKVAVRGAGVRAAGVRGAGVRAAGVRGAGVRGAGVRGAGVRAGGLSG